MLRPLSMLSLLIPRRHVIEYECRYLLPISFFQLAQDEVALAVKRQIVMVNVFDIKLSLTSSK